MFLKWFKQLVCYLIGHKNVECDRQKSFRETVIRIRCTRCGREETVVEAEE